ncbi:MAG TPA: hypothetical protein EYG38_01045, partial [Verrucomicrobia bacterium]|nr:hypothetical protein [Verrucomicrobiota bacterium]
MKLNRHPSILIVISVVGILTNRTFSEETGQPDKIKSPTFSEHIAPIIFNHCTSCHRENEAAPFTLSNYKEVRKRGRMIADVTQDRFMPPWHARSQDYAFQGERRLSEEQIELIRRWVTKGMPEGDPSFLPAMPKFVNGWQLGKPDSVVKMTEGYTLSAEGPDIYRNFVVSLNLTEDKWVTAIEFRPGVRSIVHHSLFFYDTTGQAMEQDAADPVPGFRRMRQGGIRNGRLGGWAVGGVPRMLPEGLAYKLPKDADLILSTHFHPSGKEEKETSTIGLYFSDQPPKQGFTAIQLPPAFGALADVDIPAGENHYSKKDFFVLPVDVKAFGVSAHAHYLGKSMWMGATLPDGNKKQLLNIPAWDFSWQEQYVYQDYVILPKGTRINAEVVWDNSDENINNPNIPPKRVRWGRESDDEMGSLTLQVVAMDPKQLPELNQAIRKHVREAATKTVNRKFSGKNTRNRESFLSRLVDQFDQDGDGKLNEAERQAARKKY